jgi:asparagine synthase (glutamine-hydrolysing)
MRRSSLDDYVAQVFQRFAIPHLVHYDDRNAMAFGVEGRMPFLDHRLVELAFTADYSAMVAGGLTKRLLRESCGDLLPPIVQARRDKVGFHTPLAEWLRGELPWIREVMNDGFVLAMGVLNAKEYRGFLARLQAGDSRSALPVWRGFVFHLWAQRFEVASPASSAGPARVAS